MKLSETRHLYIRNTLDNLYHLLREVYESDKTDYNSLAENSVLRGGSFSSAISDLKNLGFIEKRNGDGYQITEIGQEYLLKKSKIILREQALKIHLFKRCHEQIGEQATYREIRNWFEKNRFTEDNQKIFNTQFVGSIAKRYYECIAGYIPKTRVIKSRESNSTLAIVTTNKNLNLKEILLKKGISVQEIIRMLDTLPKEKRDILLEECMSS